MSDNDREKMLLGIRRLSELSESERNAMYSELAEVIARSGKHPSANVVFHVAGNVSVSDWDGAVSRMRAA